MLDIVFLGLSITSSWGNGHATTYRGLVRELAARGHRVLFLERDMPWYAAARDLPGSGQGQTLLYSDLDELKAKFTRTIHNAALVIVGSYVPDGIEVGEWVVQTAQGVTAFYDIDTPVTLAMIDENACSYLSPALIQRYDLYLSFTGGPVLDRLESHYGSPRARPLYCSADPELYFPEERPQRWHLGYMGTYSQDRRQGLRELLVKPAQRWPEGKMVVAGPQYPTRMQWPENVERIEHVPPQSHRAFYNEQRFTLNLTRREMARAGYAPSVRLFEAAACGRVIITDRWEGLETFFRLGEEILVADSAEDVLEYLKESSALDPIGRRARARVLAEHTAARRAESLETYALELLQR